MAFQSDRVSFLQTRSRVWRSGPVQSEPANRVRAGRQQLSTGPPMCRRSPDRHTGERVVSRPKPDPTSGDGSPSRSVGSPRCPTSRSTAVTARPASARSVVKSTSSRHFATPSPKTDSVTHTSSLGPAVQARPQPLASCPRSSTARTQPGANPAACATPAFQSMPAQVSMCTNSTPPPITVSMRFAISFQVRRSQLPAVTRCTSSMKSTCSRLPRRTHC